MQDSLKEMPSFTAYKDNYFITGVPLNDNISSQTADVKYQVSFKQLVTRNTLPFDSHLFITYSQKAFWNIYEESSPFNEINFNPTVGLGKAIYNKKDELVGMASLAFEHESNGRDSISSRAWNNVHATYHTKIGRKTRVGVKVWLPFMYNEGNPDLLEYIGYGELDLAHNFIKNKLILEINARKGNQWNWQGSLRSRLFFRPFKNKSQYIMLEWFTGYAESLINYTEPMNNIRIGYVIKTKSFNFLDF